MRPLHLYSDLSPAMQRALVRARQGIPVDDPRSVGVQRITAQAMERQGLLARRKTQKRREVWRLWRARHSAS